MPPPPRRSRLATLGRATLYPMSLAAVILLILVLVSRAGPSSDRHGAKALDRGGPIVGAWLASWPSDDNPAVDEFQDSTDVTLDIVDVFLDWYTPFHNVSHTLRHIAQRGSVPMLTWEAHGFTTRDIYEGKKMVGLRDGRNIPLADYLREYAEGVCEVAHDTKMPVLIRALHEMNGHWFSWGISHVAPDGTKPNTDESYKAAWIHIHDSFTSRCGHDVRFVWAVNHYSVGEAASYTGAYPGDAYVDLVGLDGYNWGTNAEWGWQWFPDVFDPVYCAVAAKTSKPMVLAETGSTERGGDKAAWIGDMFDRLASGGYPHLNGVVWFNDNKREIETGGTLDWNLDSSPESFDAFKEGVHRLRTQPGPPVDGRPVPKPNCPGADTGGGGAPDSDPVLAPLFGTILLLARRPREPLWGA